MADINDRLERLSRRDELTRRVLQHRAVPPEVAGVGGDFLDVVEAVANIVRRHPGMSIMLAPGDGRPGSAVVRVTEQHGDAEIALVTAAEGARPAAPARRDDSTATGSAAPTGPAAPVPTPVPAGSVPAESGPPAGSGRPEQRSAPAWRPPGPWRPGAAGPEYRGGQGGQAGQGGRGGQGGGQPDGWRGSG